MLGPVRAVLADGHPADRVALLGRRRRRSVCMVGVLHAFLVVVGMARSKHLTGADAAGPPALQGLRTRRRSLGSRATQAAEPAEQRHLVRPGGDCPHGERLWRRARRLGRHRRRDREGSTSATSESSGSTGTSSATEGSAGSSSDGSGAPTVTFSRPDCARRRACPRSRALRPPPSSRRRSGSVAV